MPISESGFRPRSSLRSLFEASSLLPQLVFIGIVRVLSNLLTKCNGMHCSGQDQLNLPRLEPRVGFAILMLAFCLATGCASDLSGNPTADALPVGNSILTGVPNERLDKIEQTVMAPRRWVRKLRGSDAPEPAFVRDHPPEVVLEYLAENKIDGIHIDVDVYQPKRQWQRLKTASHVGPIAKYTFGTLSLLRDAMLPARVLNQDRYNHFTKTLSINSDSEASTLYESAIAKEHLSAKYFRPATIAQRLPIGTTIARIRAGNDAIKFANQKNDLELEAELYPVVYSSVVSEALGDIGIFTDYSLNFPQRIAARIGATQVGKAVGSWQKSRHR